MATNIDTALVEKQDAQHLLYWVSRDIAEGLQSGSFTTHLMNAISAADLGNRARLKLGFPSMVTAYELYNDDIRGMEKLKLIATSYKSGDIRFSKCPDCRGQDSASYDDNGRMQTWCGRCGGEGRLTV